MCGRYRLKNSAIMPADAPKDFPSLLKLDRQLEHRPRYNIAPTQFNPVVLKPSPETEPTLAAFRWGLIPPWSRDLKMSFTTINARSETVATSKVFAEPFKNRHCLALPQCWALLNRLAVYGANQQKQFSWVYIEGPLHLVAASLQTREALQRMGIDVWNVPPMAGK